MHVFTFRLSDGKGVNCPGFHLTLFEIKHEPDGLYGRRPMPSAKPQTTGAA
jgi:hypothetical protein